MPAEFPYPLSYHITSAMTALKFGMFHDSYHKKRCLPKTVSSDSESSRLQFNFSLAVDMHNDRLEKEGLGITWIKIISASRLIIANEPVRSANASCAMSPSVLSSHVRLRFSFGV